MRNLVALVLLASAGLACTTPETSSGDDAPTPYLVEVDTASFDSVSKEVQRVGGKIVNANPELSILSIESTDPSTLAKMPGVVDVRTEIVVRPISAALPTQTIPSRHLATIKATDSDLAQANNGLQSDGAGWAVVIIDDGIDSGHPYLSDSQGRSRVIAEACRTNRNCAGGTSRADGPGAARHTGKAWHGTHVAGIAAGDSRGTQTLIPRGVARAADIMAVNVFESNGSALGSNIDAALQWTLEMRRSGAKIASVNLSFTSLVLFPNNCDSSSPTTKRLIDELLLEGVVVVTASGNGGARNGTTWPACLSNILPVGSVANSQQVATESNIGPVIVARGLLAPGQSVCSSVNRTRATSGYGCTSGTSMAAPFVAGTIALLRQKAPNLTASQVVSALRTTSNVINDNRPGGTVTGLKVLDVSAALSAIVNR